MGCIREGRDSEYRELVADFVDLSSRNHLLLNVGKTKETVVDYRRKKTAIEPVIMMGEEVGVVMQYKYLGVHLNEDWTGAPTPMLCTRKG